MSVVELRFYAWNAPNGTLLGTLTDEDVESFEIRPEHRGAGTGHFTITRSNPNATTALLGFGHNSLAGPRLVKVHFPWMPAPYDTEPAWAFWLWEGDFSLLNNDGDDTLTFSGPGVRGIWSEYVLYHSSTTDDQPARGSADRDDLWWWINEPYGAIATRIFEEGRHAPYPGAADANSTFQFVTIDFNRTTDSDGETWSSIAEEYQQSIGADAGSVLADLEEAGDFTLVGTPDLLFSAYEAYGDDLTGTSYGAGVVRVQGDTNTDADNILTDLSRHAVLNRQRTHLLGRDSVSDYFTEIHPSYSSGPERWRSVEFDETNDDTLLNKKAAQIFVEEQQAQNAIEVEVKPGNSPSTGRYLPFVHFKTGDTVTVDTGSAEHDYTNEDALLSAFRVVLAEASSDVTDDDAARSLHVILELNTARTGGGIPSASAGNGGIGCKCPRPCSALIPGTETITRLYFHPDAGDVEPDADDGWDAGSSDVHTLSTTPEGDYSATHSATSSAGGGVGTGTNVLYWAGVYEMPSGMAAIIAAGGATVRAQIRSRARFGIGISESSQDMISQIYLGVTTGASATIRGTALELHGLTSSTGASKWPANATKINKQFPPTGAGNVLSSVSGTATGDYLVVEVGNRNYTPSTTGGAIALTNDNDADLPEDDTSSDAFNSWLEIRAISPPIGTGNHPDLVGTDKDYARCDHKHHILATRDPNSSDDITQGYPTTTLWTNTDSNQSFVLVDEDTGEWVPFATPGVGEHTHTAGEIEYDPTTSGLTSDTVQEAIDELADTVGEGVFLEKSDGENHTVNVVAATGSTETIDLSTGNYQDFTLDDDCTFTMPSPAAGKTFTAFVRQDGTGGWTPTFTDVEWPADTPPEWSTDPDTVDIVEFISDASVWYGFSGIDDTGGSLTDHNHTTAGGDGGDLDGALIGDFLEFTEASAPSTPATGFARVYAKSDGRIYSMDEGGTEYGPFDAAGGGGGGCTAPTGFPDIGTTANTQVSTNSTSHVVNLPSGITAGKLLLIVGGMDGAPTASATGWTSIATDDGGGVVSVVALYKFASGSEGATVTVTLTASEKAEWWSAIIDDAHASTPPEGAAAGLGSAQGLMKPPSVTPSWGADDTLWIGVAVGDLSAAANLRIAGQPIEHVFVWYHSLAATDGVHMALALRWLNTATHDTPPFYTSDVSYGNGSEQWATATVAVRPV